MREKGEDEEKDADDAHDDERAFSPLQDRPAPQGTSRAFTVAVTGAA